MNSSDKSLYQIPYYPEAQPEPAFEKPTIKIAYDAPKHMPLNQKQQIKKPNFRNIYQNIPSSQIDIFGEMFAKSAQILHFRTLAEEEIRLSHLKYTRKSFLKNSKKHESNQLYYKYLFAGFKKNPQDISRALINLESKVGMKIFGPVSNGIRREFFVLDHNSWIYHEEWIDGRQKVHQNTIRYELRKDQVIKIEAGPHYFDLKGAELRNFHHAVQTYYQNVSRLVYGRQV